MSDVDDVLTRLAERLGYINHPMEVWERQPPPYRYGNKAKMWKLERRVLRRAKLRAALDGELREVLEHYEYLSELDWDEDRAVLAREIGIARLNLRALVARAKGEA